MMSREISNFERGMLIGIPIGAIGGPSIALVLFVLIVCYDLGRPRIVDVGQQMVNKYFGIDINTPVYDRGGSPTLLSDEEKVMLNQLLSKINGGKESTG